MPELLLELVSEEIPARMQARAAQDLAQLVSAGLAKGGFALDTAQVRTYVTPRRLMLVVNDLPLAQPDGFEERRGPRADAPEAAIQGFLRASGITLDQAETRETPKGPFYFATITRKGRATAEVIREVIEAVLIAFPWPKSMRWGSGQTRWVRPLQRIVCLFNRRVVPVQFAGVEACGESEGHRFLTPHTFRVTDFACLKRGLDEAHVMFDPEQRRITIWDAAVTAAAAEGLTVKPDEGLLREVVGLVEWPVVLIGRIDDAFMDVPAEVLTTAMRTHQKYFSLTRPDGTMAPRFIVVSNMETRDGGKAIIAGNERVLRARLSDAKFFWDQDRRHTLESRVPKLAERIFHAKLGTVADKVERVRALALALVPYVPGAEAAAADRAALLCKADLSSGMVGEFPELQGVMGRYYAIHDGESPQVADAIAEHYSPLGPNDSCPTRPLSVVVALADKINTLAGFWRIDEKPTGSKDPFALRRAALGVIRLIVENGLRLPLAKVFATALESHVLARPGVDDPDAVARDLLDFFADRLKVHLREQGVRHDLVAAVFAQTHEDDLVRLLARVAALDRFLHTDDGANLLVAYRRAANIVRIEEKRDVASYVGAVDSTLLTQNEEHAMVAAIEGIQGDLARAVGGERYDEAMGCLARLRSSVDAFFGTVTVNCENITLRTNRLRLLSRIGAAMAVVADFSKIEG
ncbi:MAG: glycine--tRNA ligase subunit beta [Alphaproteobacteria bacterium]|nr:glycine--tRNA ligase subunit beta [Alphaproteobacteria bacterium]